MTKKGLQLYTIRTLLEKDFFGTLKEVAGYGYEGVQFAGYYDTPADRLKEALNEYGLKAAGSHVPYEQVTGDGLSQVISYNKEIGNDLIIVPYLTEEQRTDLDSYKRVAQELNKAGEVIKQQGLQLAYHNHDFEFQSFGDQTPFDVLLQETDRNLVKFELDCYWVTYAGYDPLSLIKEQRDRVASLHIKDMKETNGVKHSTVIGEGTLDMKGLLTLGKDLELPWFIAEQEHFEGELMEAVALNSKKMDELLKA
ncbi:sugar phosphate isomerase/epimerase family protein [Metabacillus indicus]|uniref:sugar phosphate isomerase/epimerase family protein n=1 Tax=Metabacillus indicus TaxID=246786 RepID=UPI002A00187A|nr:sugar phosphate isomerase/epimerase family protein [Metabacillus indicus]MDX8290879.1 sugar phosphate isomerase/epimerase family protein [Metabacillus indicus]